MLNLMKNPFAKPATKTEPPSPSAQAAEASVKGRQLLRGRTKVKVESLRAEVEAVRLALAQAEQAVGDRMVEGLDVTAATDTMKQAGDRVRVLEAALAVAVQKDEAAQAELRQAERQVASDAVTAARTTLLALAPEWETWLATANQLATQTVIAAEVLRLAELSAGVEHRSSLGDLRGQVRQSIGIALLPIAAEGFVPKGLRKHATFTDCLKSVCGG